MLNSKKNNRSFNVTLAAGGLEVLKVTLNSDKFNQFPTRLDKFGQNLNKFRQV